LEKDKKDARATRLKLTETSYEFWKMIKAEGAVFTESLFDNIDEDELTVVRRVIEKMLLNINEMDQKNERTE